MTTTEGTDCYIVDAAIEKYKEVFRTKFGLRRDVPRREIEIANVLAEALAVEMLVKVGKLEACKERFYTKHEFALEQMRGMYQKKLVKESRNTENI